MPRRAALYARVSTDGQKEEATIASQIAEIKARIEQDGAVLAVERVYQDEGYSGEVIARPDLDRLRDDARKGLFDALYVYDRGRLARKFAYQELIIEELGDLGIDFITLRDVPAETPEDRVLQAMQGVFHEYERLKIAERFRRGKLFKVRSGKFLGYNPKYGYTYLPKRENREGRLVINEAEARIVVMIYRWVADEACSIREVIRRLHRLGIPPRRGRSPRWTMSTVSRLLRDETYAGVHYYNKLEAIVPKAVETAPGRYRRLKKTSRRTRPREEWIPVEVPAIVSRDLFDRVQKQLAANVRFSTRNAKTEYLLQGLIYCACGRRRAGCPNKGYPVYRCVDRIYRFPLPAECTRRAIRSVVVETVVWEAFTSALTDARLLRRHANRWLRAQRSNQSAEATRSERAATIEADLRRLAAEEERYAVAYGEGALSLEALKSLTAGLAKRRDLLHAQLADARTHQQQPDTTPLPSTEELVEQARKLVAQLDFSDRRRLLRQLVERVTVDTQEVTIRGYLPVQELPAPPAHLRSNDTYSWNAKLPLDLRASLPKQDARGRYPTRFYVQSA